MPAFDHQSSTAIDALVILAYAERVGHDHLQMQRNALAGAPRASLVSGGDLGEPASSGFTLHAFTIRLKMTW